MQTLFVCAIALCIGLADAQGAIEKDLDELSHLVLAEAPRESLLDVVAGAMNASQGAAYLRAAKSQLPDMEVVLSPILAALPTNEEGKFDPSAVRYALHHYFVREFGWHIKGLDPLGKTWNSSSPSDTTALERMPTEVQSVMRKRLDGADFDAQDVAVLGMTLRYLIQGEFMDRLSLSYGMLDLPLQQPIAKERAEQALQFSMASYISGRNLRNVSKWQMLMIFGNIDKFYPTWNNTRSFMHDIFLSEQKQLPGGGASVNFSEVAHTTQTVNERYGRWQQGECVDLKQNLLALEEQGTGRVRLTEFYRAGLNGKWQFSESEPYLRQLGVLDDSAQSEPRVVIPNYVDSKSNCIAATRYHDLCCISECEALLGRVERSVAAPSASPDDIAKIVAALPSATVPADRVLDQVLLTRLQAIASEHNGVVPIYGRLFAQWMHHAYPRECPYPHLSGTTKPENIFEARKSDKVKSMASKDDMTRFLARKFRKSAPLQMKVWSDKEELLAPPVRHHRPVGYAAVQFFVALSALSVAILGLLRTAFHASRQQAGGADAWLQKRSWHLGSAPVSL